MSPLATVRTAARRRNAAAETYRAAVLDARAAGHSLAEIASAAGTSRQAMWRILQRNERTPKEGT